MRSSSKKTGKRHGSVDLTTVCAGRENLVEALTCPPDSDVNDFISYNLCQFIEDNEAFINFIRPEC